MMSRKDLETQVMSAARDQGISNVLFRNALGRKLDLNVTDTEALSFLTIKGSATPTELAQYTGLTTGSTTALLDRLEKGGLVKRTANPRDRRGAIVEIEPKYNQKAWPLVADIQKLNTEVIARYTDEELKTIADFLRRMTENVKDQTKKINGK
jgi:DNA-binding MarR family transcriptional regulator